MTRFTQGIYLFYSLLHKLYMDHTLSEQPVYTEYTLGIHLGHKATRQKLGVRSWNKKIRSQNERFQVPSVRSQGDAEEQGWRHGPPAVSWMNRKLR